MGIVDSHAHLTARGLEEHLPDMLARAQEVGIDYIINICTNPDELERGLQLAQDYPWIANVAATTPHDVAKEGEAHFDAIASKAKELVAIGETGLDYYYEHSDRVLQQKFLRRYLQLAKLVNLPVVIHCRNAFADFFRIIDEEYKGHPGVLHCFTGTLEEAHEVVLRGWYLSLSGIVTFKKSVELQQVAREVPLDHLLIETDTPYLAPMPHRGKRNEPAYLVNTAQCIAALRGISYEELAMATSQNALALFRLST
ncbi:MAG: TatD family hydrolase [Chlamydiales bacterium]